MQPHSANPSIELQSEVFDLTARVLTKKKGDTRGLLELPAEYYVEQGPDLLIIRRLDGSIAATFSACAADSKEIQEGVERDEDQKTLVPVAAPVDLHLQVRFFGRFEILRDSEAVSLGRSAKTLAILKYLLTRRARPVPQDYLMGWLWPESDLKRARWSLNSAIYALRKLLGCWLPSLPAPETVLFEGGRYQLSPRIRLGADTDEFDSLYEKGRRLEKDDRVPEAVAEYEKAVELYRGDYLIEDLYEEWTMIERERLVDAYTDLLRRLAIHYMESGQFWESVRTCYQILEKNRCDEDTHRLLMECFVRLGQRARALRQYGLCEQVLKHEHDIRPSLETWTFYRSILKNRERRGKVTESYTNRIE